MTGLKRTAICILPALAAALAGLVAPDRAAADSSPFIGEIAPTSVAGFCPSGWASAEGQLMAISENDALFSLIGTTFGGNGVTTFGLPDLRSRIPVAQGTGPGLSPRIWGQTGGHESVTLTVNQMAPHSHLVNATNADGNFPGPGGKLLAAAPAGGSGTETIYSDQPPNRVMSASMIGNTGGSQSFNTQDPTLVIRYCIALFGIYPSRS